MLQIRLTLFWPELPTPASILFSRPLRGLYTKIYRAPILFDLDNDNNSILKQRPQYAHNIKVTHKHFTIITIGSTVVAEREDRGPRDALHGGEALTQRLQQQIIHNPYDKDCLHHNWNNHFNETPFSTEQDLNDEITKAKNQPQLDGDFDGLVNAYMQKKLAQNYMQKDKQIITQKVPKKKAGIALKHKPYIIHNQ